MDPSIRINFLAEEHNNMRLASIVLLLLAALLSSCTTTSSIVRRTPDDGNPSYSVSQILERLPTTPDALKELYMETSVALSSPDENGRYSTRISYRKDDSLLIRVRFTLGIEGVRVLIAGDSAFVYDRVHKELVYGAADRIAEVLPGAVLGTDLVDVALDFNRPDSEVEWTLSRDSLRYHLFSPDSTIHYAIDPDIWRIVQYERRSSGGTILEQRWYTEFKLFNNIVLPRRLNISRPTEDTRLSMVLRKVDTSPSSLSFNLNVKDDARRTEIR